MVALLLVACTPDAPTKGEAIHALADATQAELDAVWTAALGWGLTAAESSVNVATVDASVNQDVGACPVATVDSGALNLHASDCTGENSRRVWNGNVVERNVALGAAPVDYPRNIDGSFDVMWTEWSEDGENGARSYDGTWAQSSLGASGEAFTRQVDVLAEIEGYPAFRTVQDVSCGGGMYFSFQCAEAAPTVATVDGLGTLEVQSQAVTFTDGSLAGEFIVTGPIDALTLHADTLYGAACLKGELENGDAISTCLIVTDPDDRVFLGNANPYSAGPIAESGFVAGEADDSLVYEVGVDPAADVSAVSLDLVASWSDAPPAESHALVRDGDDAFGNSAWAVTLVLTEGPVDATSTQIDVARTDETARRFESRDAAGAVTGCEFGGAAEDAPDTYFDNTDCPLAP